MIANVLGAYGQSMAHAQGSDSPRSIKMPWTGTDDEFVANVATGSLRDLLKLWLTTERGIHAETLLVSIGAIAGFAAQQAARVRAPVSTIGTPITARDRIHEVKTKSGETFYFGDPINGYIVPQGITDLNLWGLVAAAANSVGVKQSEFPELAPMFRRVAGSVGSPEFGTLTVDKRHQPQLSPRQALDLLWPRARFLLTRTDGPGPGKGRSVPQEYWSIVASIAAQQLLILTKDTLDPRVGLALIMESAIAMSKIDPKTVPQTPPEKPPAALQKK